MSPPILPVTFRAPVIAQVFTLAQQSDSCAVFGVASVGKGNVARHMLRPDVQQYYFAANAPRVLLVLINCKPFTSQPLAQFYWHMLDCLNQTLQERAPQFAAEQARINTLWLETQANVELLARRNLDRAVGLLQKANAFRVLFILDDCDDLFAKAAPVLFSDLRALRDNYKRMLVYVLLTRREPVYLRTDAPEYEELYELVSLPLQMIPIPPYSEADANEMCRQLAARQTPPRDLTDLELRRLYDLSGGHAGLLRRIYYLASARAELMAPDIVTRLATKADLQEECEKIWNSLEEEERAEFHQWAHGQGMSTPGARRLEQRGLVRIRLTHAPEIFSPIFERCLMQLTGAGDTVSPTIEFTGLGNQARVNGLIIYTLSDPECHILRLLLAHRPKGAPHAELIQAMLAGETTEAGVNKQTPPTHRLQEYIRLLKAKLGPAGQFIVADGDGFRLN